MKLKLFTIGLLATIAMTSTTVEAAQRQRAQVQATQEVPVLQQQIAAGGPNHPDLDTATHLDNATALADLHAKLGAAAGATGATANHRITDLHTTLGHAAAGGAVGDHANKKAEDALNLLQGGAANIHTAINNINTTLGPVRASASRRGKGVLPAAALMPNVSTKLNAILLRLKAGLAATAAAGVHVHAVAETKTTHTAIGAVAAGDEAAAAGAADIENFLAEIGW